MTVDWSDAADKKGNEILRLYGEALFDEAERVTGRAGADRVTETFLTEAADAVRLRRGPSPVADVMFAVGLALLGIAAGVGAIQVTAPQPLVIGKWVDPVAIAVLFVGALLTGIGGAMKMKRR